MKLDVDLQSWSELMSGVCDRRVPYEQLTEVDQVTDRLTLEKVETLLSLVDENAREQIIDIVHKKLSERDDA
jgi:electron transfer flavoprotein alpha/beta subunit